MLLPGRGRGVGGLRPRRGAATRRAGTRLGQRRRRSRHHGLFRNVPVEEQIQAGGEQDRHHAEAAQNDKSLHVASPFDIPSRGAYKAHAALQRNSRTDAVLAAGGRTIGIIPDFLQRREVAHTGVELEVVDSMHTRKRRMFDLADAFLVLPGGIGTLDETMEILTWRQLGHHDKPVVLVDVNGYWHKLTALLNHVIRSDFAGAELSGFYSVAETPEAALEAAERAPKRHPGSGSGLF